CGRTPGQKPPTPPHSRTGAVAPTPRSGQDAAHPGERSAMGNRTITALLVLLAMALAMLAGCRREPPADATPVEAATPGEAVRRLTAHLQAGDLEAFARDAVTPEVHRRLQVAWSEGRTRWPLDQLPFAQHIPRGMAARHAPGAPQSLQRGFEGQRAGASVQAAAEFLTLLTVQYIVQQGEFSVSEREHYPQLVQAIGDWAGGAPIAA